MLRRTRIALTIGLALLGAAARADGQRWWSHVLVLADDRMEGRNTGSEGHRKAAAYVAEQFERAGLNPAGTAGYIQPVKLRARRILEERSSLTLVRHGNPEPLVLGEDATLSVRVEPAPLLEAAIVFVGYGLTVPEQHHDDLAGLDLRGKVALLLSGGPSSIPGPLRAHYQSAGERWTFLKRAGVVGTMTIPNPRTMDIPWARSTLARLQPFMSLADHALDETAGQQLAATVNPAHADKFFAGSGHSLRDLLALADSGKPLPTFALPVSVKATTEFESSEVGSQNVAGVLPGTDPTLKNEYVVLSAHLDHVGIGQPINGDAIYNGAMDNASGVATLLDIAESLHEANKHFRRSLLFLAVTGEEKGLLGSKYFTAHPTVKREAMVADLNTDMFLPLFPLRILTALGVDESDLGDELRTVVAPLGIRVQTDPEPDRNRFIRSDQYNFIRGGVPSLALKVGYEPGSPEAALVKKWLTERYHAPSDDVHQPVDLTAAADFGKVLLLLTERVANRPERPRWRSESFFRRFAS